MAIGLCGLIAVPLLAQVVPEEPLPGNPYRRAGGRCVYGKKGEVVYAPSDVRCESREEPAPEAGSAAAAERFGRLPLALRTQANALIDSHVHVADDLSELRRAVAQDDKAKALVLSDEVVKELVDHLAREQAFFEKLAAEHGSH